MTRSTLSTLTSLRILIPLIMILAAVAIYLNRQKLTTKTTEQTESATRTISILTAVLLLIYFIIYLYLTFGYRRPSKEPKLKPELLWSYRDAFQLNPLKITRLGLAREIFLNILLTIPAGLLLPILYRTKHPYLLTAATILLVSLLTEVFQYYTHLGFAETDDVINNFLGGLLGMGILRAGSIMPRKAGNI